MWSWFYSPERLPKTYLSWISKIAQLDHRLLTALRLCRQGNLTYGSTTTENAHLPELCKELNLPEVMGNPTLTVPIPCELYHCGAGESCEVHAAMRFWNTFKLSMRIYLPLQGLDLLRRSDLRISSVFTVLQNAARSSSFLATFVGSFYYAVCLSRTRLGPRLFPSVSPQSWDSGLCVLAGCVLCGWSILVEKFSRQQEIALFVAPRAIATLLPRVYERTNQTREQLVFAASVATVMTAIQNRNRRHVRGVLGTVIERVLR